MLALMALASCAGQPGVRPPSLDDVRVWLDRLAPELPKLVAKLRLEGGITPEGAILVQVQSQSLQGIATRLNQLAPGQDPVPLINDLGVMLDAILSLTPATAPFVPLLMMLRALLVAYIRGETLRSQQGEPIPPPPPPSPQQLQQTAS